jgi:hypothetical protein
MPKATSGGPAPCRPACQGGAPLTGMPAAPRWQPRRHVVIPGQAPASAWASGKGGVGAWRTRPLRRLASCQRPTRLPVVAALRTHLPVPGRPSRQQGTSRVETRDLPGANPAPACCSYRDRVASVDRGGLLKLRFVLFGSNFQVAGVRRIIIRPECALLSRVRAGCSRTHAQIQRASTAKGPSQPRI